MFPPCQRVVLLTYKARFVRKVVLSRTDLPFNLPGRSWTVAADIRVGNFLRTWTVHDLPPEAFEDSSTEVVPVGLAACLPPPL
jgi:hypothetical protein